MKRSTRKLNSKWSDDDDNVPLASGGGGGGDERKETIVIIGTGNYGIALGKRLLQYCGESFDVVYGSRQPNAKYVAECLDDYGAWQHGHKVRVTSLDEAWQLSDTIVFMAVSADVYDEVIDNMASSSSAKLSSNQQKIVVDISNPLENEAQRRPGEKSNAERLQHTLNEHFAGKQPVTVLKAFNTVSAYSMGAIDFTETKGDSETVPIAGDDVAAKASLQRLCARLGFAARDIGPLRSARSLEQAQCRGAFPEWVWPSAFSLGLALFNFTWIFVWYFLFPKKPHASFAAYLATFNLMGHLNRSLGFTSLHLLAYTYLPGVLAALLQLCRGTKYVRFPRLLDAWLKARKQLGLWAFLVASAHLCVTAFVLNPAYLDVWYQRPTAAVLAAQPNAFNATMMTLNGELNTLSGVLAYLVLCLVALSSINSIAQSLSWSEWRFVQTKLGVTCLVLGTLHDVSMYARMVLERDMYKYDTKYLLTRVKLIVLALPCLVLLGKFIVSYVPPFSTRLERIRNGSKKVVSNNKT